MFRSVNGIRDCFSTNCVDVLRQLRRGQLRRQELSEDVFPGGFLQVLPEPVSGDRGALDRDLQAQLLAEEPIEHTPQPGAGLYLFIEDPARLHIPVHDVP
jgi:hypothetical protein